MDSFTASQKEVNLTISKNWHDLPREVKLHLGLPENQIERRYIINSWAMKFWKNKCRELLSFNGGQNG